mmetsp:Transcript_7755/g.23464  ORF Transcript_7755/g.23464 Transcript_7755/m.23464 type:complete len:315 (+) Transcript_7755:108-1052(+)
MLLILVGPICSGKRTALKWLVTECGFKEADREDGLQSASLALPTPLVTIGSRSRELVPLIASVSSFVVAVDAPLLERKKRFEASAGGAVGRKFELEMDDEMYAEIEGCRGKNLKELMRNACIHIMNDGTLKQFHEQLKEQNFGSPSYARISWDDYFLRLAVLTSKRTNCMKRAVGAVIVKNNRVIATGYNGTASGVPNCNEGGCGRCNDMTPVGRNLGECFCLHAEENAIIEAGAARCEDAILYTSLSPCLACAKQIIQAGISTVIFDLEYGADARSCFILNAAGINLLKRGQRITAKDRPVQGFLHAERRVKN